MLGSNDKTPLAAIAPRIAPNILRSFAGII
jgi:hypothetical protein